MSPGVNLLILCHTQYTYRSARAGAERHRAEPGRPTGPGLSGSEAPGDVAPPGMGGPPALPRERMGGVTGKAQGRHPWATGLPDAGG